MEFEYYRLPDGGIIPVDVTASKGAATIGVTERGGRIVTATRVDTSACVRVRAVPESVPDGPQDVPVQGTLAQYPPLPDPPTQRTDEPLEAYGERLLAFVIRTETTATLDRRQLERAHQAATRALASRLVIVDGQDRSTTPVCVYDRIETARGRLTRVLDERNAREASTDSVRVFSGVQDNELGGDGGYRVRVLDRPRSEPPAGAQADVTREDAALPRIPRIPRIPRLKANIVDIVDIPF